MRVVRVVCFACCGPFWSALALATPTVQLSYARAEGAESCPRTAEVRAAISQRLGYDPVDPNSPQIMAAIVESTPTGFRARVELIAGGNSQGVRELTSSGTCAELVTAMALSMSLAIDPERAEQGSSAAGSGAFAALDTPSGEGVTPASGPGTASAAAPAPAPPTQPKEPPPVVRAPIASRRFEQAEPEPARRRDRLKLPIDYSVAAFAQMASGFVADAAPGASLLVRGRRGLFSVSLEGRLDAPAGTDLSGGGRVESGLAAVIIAPCVHYDPGYACVLGLGGQVWASSSSVSDARNDVVLYGALGARVGVEWPERGIAAISLHADALRALTRVSIELDREAVWKAPTLALAFGAGAVARF